MQQTKTYKTQEYRIHLTAEQKKLLEADFHFEDETYNHLADLANNLHQQDAPLSYVQEQIKAYQPPICNCTRHQISLEHTKKTILRAAANLYDGTYKTIYLRNYARGQRGFYCKGISVTATHVIVPHLGRMPRDTHRGLYPGSIILSAQIFCNVYEDRYRIAILVSCPCDAAEMKLPIRYENAIGIDYAQDGLYMDSNGNTGDYPAYLAQSEAKIRNLQAAIARATYGSKRWYKLKGRLSKVKRHAQNQRKDWQYKAAKQMVQEHDLVAFETLDFKRMQQDKPQLAPKIKDNAFPLFTKKAVDYANESGKCIVFVNPYYPSSQICSVCGYHIGKIPLSERRIACPQCGTVMHRDINAAKNILREGLRIAH
ncbi:MAG: transposase [Faecalibacterium sp.]